MPTTFHESDLEFTFNDDWIVKAYDEHPFYKSLAGQGLKGVDFIGILNLETVVLIEVKNYKIRFPTAVPPIQDKITGDCPAIVETMKRKVADTRRALRIIRKYYQRRWWLRPLQWLLKKMPLRYQLGIEWQFWLWLEAKVAQNDYAVVLWMELEESYDFFTSQQVQQARTMTEHQLKKQFQHLATEVFLADKQRPFTLGNSRIYVRKT